MVPSNTPPTLAEMLLKNIKIIVPVVVIAVVAILFGFNYLKRGKK